MIEYKPFKNYTEAAEEEAKLREVIRVFTAGNPRIEKHQVDVRERRGDKVPDITKLKLRTS